MAERQTSHERVGWGEKGAPASAGPHTPDFTPLHTPDVARRKTSAIVAAARLAPAWPPHSGPATASGPQLAARIATLVLAPGRDHGNGASLHLQS